jgi:hypothetical protein
MSYRYDYKEEDNGAEQCPYCGKPKPSFVFLEAYAWENGIRGKNQWVFAREFVNSSTIRLPARIFSLFPLIKGDIPVLEIEVDETSVLFKKLDDLNINFSIAAKSLDQGQFKELSSQMRFRSPPGSTVRDTFGFIILAEANNFSRIIFFDIRDNGAVQ